MKRAKGNAALVEAATDEKIVELNVDGLKKYLCAKSRGRWEACLECPKQCSAGTRYLFLMDEETKPENDKPAKDINPGLALAAEHRTNKARQKCLDAIQSGNPIGYLMKIGGISEKAARERIRVYINRYPELWEGIEKPVHKFNDRVREQRMVKIQLLKEALETDSPVKYIAEKNGVKLSVARQNYYSYRMMAAEEGVILKAMPASVKGLDEKTDEVSVAEFLNETAPEPVEADPSQNDNPTPEAALLKKKQEELEEEERQIWAKIGWHEESIAELKEKAEWIEAKKKALADVLSLFQ